jgi:hypothetical protein
VAPKIVKTQEGAQREAGREASGEVASEDEEGRLEDIKLVEEKGVQRIVASGV